MSALESLEKLHWMILLAADALILYFALSAYWRTKLRVFGFVIIASVVAFIQVVVVETHDTSRLSAADYDSFMLVWRISYIITVILSTTATIMLIRHILHRATQKNAT